MLGISTCWWDHHALDGESIIKEIIDLGLDGLELEYRITHPIYQQMKPLLNKAIKVLSIHNYFPKPNDFIHEKASGDLFLLSSLDNYERSLAVQYTLKTMEYASDLEVLPVVLHLGRVDMPNPIDVLRDYYKKEAIDQEEGRAFLKEQGLLRADKSQKYLDAVLFSLDRLNREAENKGITLCIENRYHFHEIPNFQEIGIILNEFRGGRLRYWHDMGHAAAQEALGICKQKELLDAYSENMFGIHIHDINGLDDHLPPGKGSFDYGEWIPLIKPDIPKILEINYNTSKKDLQEGIEFIKGCL